VLIANAFFRKTGKSLSRYLDAGSPLGSLHQISTLESTSSLAGPTNHMNWRIQERDV